MEFALIAVVVLIAAVVQGSVGFGLGMLAAPAIGLTKPEMLPGTLLVLAAGMTLAGFLRDRRAVDWKVFGWASIGRVPGTIVGALLVGVLPTAGLSLTLALTVLLAASLSSIGWSPRATRGSLLVAGAASGVIGTSTSIGGPPLAIVLRRLAGPRLRGTMSAIFFGGSAISLLSLYLTGSLSSYHLTSALALAPVVGIGLLLSVPVSRRVPASRIYLVAILASVLGAAFLVIQSVIQLLS